MLHKVNQAVAKIKFVAAFLFTNKMTNYSNITNDIFVDLIYHIVSMISKNLQFHLIIPNYLVKPEKALGFVSLNFLGQHSGNIFSLIDGKNNLQLQLLSFEASFSY